MGEREKIASETVEQKAALEKKLRAANRWYLWQRCIDLAFALMITGCVLVGCYHYVFTAILLLFIVLCLAQWHYRFFSNKPITGHTDVWEIDDPSPAEHWHESTDSHDAGGSDSVDSGGD
jgi:hypothetical protein